ncbi:hypothetical protein GGD63_004645 [Bradyrhizobium sp. cir1]|nr:hypothetical protein [Bradyrhizobium sp. cir1]
MPQTVSDFIVQRLHQRTVLTRRTPTALINNLQKEPYESPPRAHGTLRQVIETILPRME